MVPSLPSRAKAAERDSRAFRAGPYSIDLSRPRVMGILNVTPDSFSDGGAYSDPEKALDRALEMEAEGAAVIDVGGESSRPGSSPVSADEEIARVVPVLRLLKKRVKTPVSIDTCKFEVMETALGEGAAIVNDIRAMHADRRIPRLIARSGSAIILMHMRGTPQTMQECVEYQDLTGEVTSYLDAAAKQALDAGVPRDRIIVDPGIGFGKSAEGNCELIRRIGRFRDAFAYPLLVGVSRKSFLRKLAGEDCDLESANAAAHAVAVLNGADILRAHDVKGAGRVIRLTLALSSP